MEEEARGGPAWDFTKYGWPLEMVSSFQYLGRKLSATGDDWMDVSGNLRKDLRHWLRLSRICGWEGVDVQT